MFEILYFNFEWNRKKKKKKLKEKEFFHFFQSKKINKVKRFLNWATVPFEKKKIPFARRPVFRPPTAVPNLIFLISEFL